MGVAGCADMPPLRKEMKFGGDRVTDSFEKVDLVFCAPRPGICGLEKWACLARCKLCGAEAGNVVAIGVRAAI